MATPARYFDLVRDMKHPYDHRLRLVESAKHRGIKATARLFATTVLNGPTPLTRTSGQFTYFLDANWRNPAQAEAAMAWVDESWSAIQPFSSTSYVNYLSNNSGDSVQATYRGSYQRLVALKRKYDPTNVFHLNRNIRPKCLAHFARVVAYSVKDLWQSRAEVTGHIVGDPEVAHLFPLTSEWPVIRGQSPKGGSRLRY